MYKRLLVVVIFFFPYCLLKAQFFQATLTNEGNELVISLVPVCGDIGPIGITQVEFAIRSTTTSPFTYGAVAVNDTNFPNAPAIMVIGSSMIPGGAGVVTKFGASPLITNTPSGSYTDGTPYELARIPISGGTGIGDFELFADGGFIDPLFSLQVDDGSGTPADANYFLCLGGTPNSQVSCNASCMAMVDNFFTGDDVGSSPDYTEGTDNVPLPAELLTFTANLDQQSALLKWETAQEINFKGYEVERSMDGKDFEPIAWIDGTGTTLEYQRYTYTDKTIANGETYYYRLRMVDLDLTFEHSPVVVLTTKGGKTEYVHIAPNPATDWIHFELNLNSGSSTRIELHELSGKLVHQEVREFNEGLNRVQIDGNRLAAGIYLLSVHTEQTIFTERLIIE